MVSALPSPNDVTWF